MTFLREIILFFWYIISFSCDRYELLYQNIMPEVKQVNFSFH